MKSLYTELNNYLPSDLVLEVFSFIPEELIPYYHPDGYKSKAFNTGGWKSMSDPATVAAKYGLINLLEWERELPLKQKDDHKIWDEIYMIAAKYGHLNILEWGETHPTFYTTKSNDVCSAAASGGHLSVVKWAYERGYGHSKIFQEAAVNGHYDIFEYMIEEGLKMITEFDEDDISRSLYGLGYFSIGKYEDREDILSSIITEDRIDVLKWFGSTGLLETFSDDFRSSSLYDAAISSCNLPILKWLVEDGTFPFETNELDLEGLDEKKVLEMIKWIYSEQGREIPNLHIFAARADFATILQWMVSDQGFTHIDIRYLYFPSIWDSNNGNVLKWILEEIDTPDLFVDEQSNGPLSFNWELILCSALETGNVKVMEWVIDSTDESLDTYRGYIQGTFQTLVKRGCIDSVKTFMRLTDMNPFKNTSWAVVDALKHGHLQLAKWLEEQRDCTSDNSFYHYYKGIFIRKMDIESLKWVRSIDDYGKIPHEVIETGASQGLLPIVIWLLRNGRTISRQVFLSAIRGDSLNVLIWLEGAYPKAFNRYRGDMLKILKDDKVGKYLRR